MNFSSNRQKARLHVAKIIFQRMRAENVRIEEFCGEIYLNADHELGQVALVVKKRGGLEYLTLPKGLSSWKKALK